MIGGVFFIIIIIHHHHHHNHNGMNQFKIEICEFSCMSCISNLVPVYKPFSFDSLCAMLCALYSDGG